MFENIAKQWREARGTRLKEELKDSVQRLNKLRGADAQRFGLALSGAYNQWLEKNGPVKESPESFRKQMAKELMVLAKERYGHDIGSSYAWAFLSFHVESSFLPGEDATFVHETTAKCVSEAHELVQKINNSGRKN